jgi:aryl-alcohol dehydrogenase-like predicted oxidoreductase
MTDTRRIGRLEVGVAGLGGNNFGTRLDAAATREVVEAALDAGVTLFDTADLYGGGASERFLGRALRAWRDEVVITTKFGMMKAAGGLSGGDPAWVARACDESRERLGVDHIDLYLLHQPDSATPIVDTLAAMNRLLEQGKVLEIGCSNFSAAQLDEAARAAADNGLRGFACVQNQFSLLHREPEDGVLEACERLGVSFVPFFPLGSGALSGKYRRGVAAPGTRLGAGGEPAELALGEERLAATERLTDFAEARGHTLLELALSWLTAHPQVASVIAGATSAAQVRANAAATGTWRLNAAELKEARELAGRA